MAVDGGAGDAELVGDLLHGVAPFAVLAALVVHLARQRDLPRPEFRLLPTGAARVPRRLTSPGGGAPNRYASGRYADTWWGHTGDTPTSHTDDPSATWTPIIWALVPNGVGKPTSFGLSHLSWQVKSRELRRHPGDPTEHRRCLGDVAASFRTRRPHVPLFGICYGFQVLALSVVPARSTSR